MHCNDSSSNSLMVFKLNSEDTLIKVVFFKMYATNICNIVDIKKIVYLYIQNVLHKLLQIMA